MLIPTSNNLQQLFEAASLTAKNCHLAVASSCFCDQEITTSDIVLFCREVSLDSRWKNTVLFFAYFFSLFFFVFAVDKTKKT